MLTSNVSSQKKQFAAYSKIWIKLLWLVLRVEFSLLTASLFEKEGLHLGTSHENTIFTAHPNRFLLLVENL